MYATSCHTLPLPRLPRLQSSKYTVYDGEAAPDRDPYKPSFNSCTCAPNTQLNGLKATVTPTTCRELYNRETQGQYNSGCVYLVIMYFTIGLYLSPLEFFIFLGVSLLSIVCGANIGNYLFVKNNFKILYKNHYSYLCH